MGVLFRSSPTPDSAPCQKSRPDSDSTSEVEPALGKVLEAFKDPVGFAKKMARFFGVLLNGPTWERLAEVTGCDKVDKRPKRLAPSDKHCKDHGVEMIQHAMGVSCWVFAIPLLVYMMFCSVRVEGSNNAWALGLSIVLGYVSVFSFLADYWYTGDTPETNSAVPEHQKQLICNTIDMVNVQFAGLCLTTTCCLQTCFASSHNWMYPVGFVLFVIGAFFQVKETYHLNKFINLLSETDYDNSAPTAEAQNAIWYGLFYHILWHLFAIVGPTAQVYGLLMHGVHVPWC